MFQDYPLEEIFVISGYEESQSDRLICDEDFEFDAPQYFNFNELRQLFENCGYDSMTQYLSQQNKEHEDWFQRDHPEHEREFQPEPVNLLRSDSDNEDNENEVSENQYLSQFAASFAEELTLNDKDADHAVDGKIAEADTTLKSSSSQRTTATLTASITRPGLQEKTKPLAIPKLSMKTKSVCPLDDQRERAQISNSITLRNRNHGHIAKTANKENKKMLSCKMPQKAPTEQQIMQLIEKHNKQARKARVQQVLTAGKQALARSQRVLANKPSDNNSHTKQSNKHQQTQVNKCQINQKEVVQVRDTQYT